MPIISVAECELQSLAATRPLRERCPALQEVSGECNSFTTHFVEDRPPGGGNQKGTIYALLSIYALCYVASQ